MGLLTRSTAGLWSTLAVLAGAPGCYSPSLADCTVSCAGPSECASGQVCGNDGLCAAPEVAGRCMIAPDAGADAALDAGVIIDAPIPVMIDAAVPDAPPPPPPKTVKLRVQIGGKGRVVVDGRGTCSASAGPGGGDCTFDVARGAAQTVRAVPIQLDQRFLSWSSPTCRGQSATCTFTPAADTVVVAQFGK